MIPSTTRSHSFLSLIPNNTNIGQVNILRKRKLKRIYLKLTQNIITTFLEKKNIKENNVDIIY